MKFITLAQEIVTSISSFKNIEERTGQSIDIEMTEDYRKTEHETSLGTSCQFVQLFGSINVWTFV